MHIDRQFSYKLERSFRFTFNTDD